MRDKISGHEGMSKATEKMMHSRQGRNRRLSEDEHASDAPDRGGRQQAPEKSSSPSSPAGSWAFSNGNGRNKSPSREERASDAHPQGGVGSELRKGAGLHLSSLARTVLFAALPTTSTHPAPAKRSTGSRLRRDAGIHLGPLALKSWLAVIRVNMTVMATGAPHSPGWYLASCLVLT